MRQRIKTGPTSDSPIIIVGGSLGFRSPKDDLSLQEEDNSAKHPKTYRIYWVTLHGADDDNSASWVCPGVDMTLEVTYTDGGGTQKLTATAPACKNLSLTTTEKWKQFDRYPNKDAARKVVHKKNDIQVQQIVLTYKGYIPLKITCDAGCMAIIHYAP